MKAVTQLYKFDFVCFFVLRTILDMSAWRQRILDLLHAQVPVGEIVTIVSINRRTVSNVRRMFEERDGVERKEGSGGHNLKRTATFNNDLKEQIDASPTTSMRKLAKENNVSEITIRRSVKDLGMVSYVDSWCLRGPRRPESQRALSC